MNSWSIFFPQPETYKEAPIHTKLHIYEYPHQDKCKKYFLISEACKMSLALSGFWDITRAVTFVFYPGLFSQLCSESSYTSVLCPRPPWCCYLSSGACLTTVVWPLIRTVFNQWYPNQQCVVKTWDPHSLYLSNLINFSYT